MTSTDTNTDDTETTGQTSRINTPVTPSEDTTFSFPEQVLYVAEQWLHQQYGTDDQQFAAEICYKDISETIAKWNTSLFYPKDDPTQRLITQLESLIEQWETKGDRNPPTQQVKNHCATDIKNAINKQQLKIETERCLDDPVTLLIDRDSGNVIDGIIIEDGDDIKISREHKNLRDYTEIKQTTREKAEELLSENDIEPMY